MPLPSGLVSTINLQEIINALQILLQVKNPVLTTLLKKKNLLIANYTIKLSRAFMHFEKSQMKLWPRVLNIRSLMKDV